jgi:hypothetical protein
MRRAVRRQLDRAFGGSAPIKGIVRRGAAPSGRPAASGAFAHRIRAFQTAIINLKVHGAQGARLGQRCPNRQVCLSVGPSELDRSDQPHVTDELQPNRLPHGRDALRYTNRPQASRWRART